MAGVPNAVWIDADLEIEDPWGRRLHLRVRDSRGVVAVPRAVLGFRTLRGLPPRRERAARMQDLLPFVSRAGLHLGVTCGGRTVARLGPQSRGNWLGRLLRVAPVELSLGGILAAVLLPPRRI